MVDFKDFNYNGIPIFNVGFKDFDLFITHMENGNRILPKNIESPKLQEHYRKYRTNNFGVCYEGVIIELNKLKKQDVDKNTQ